QLHRLTSRMPHSHITTRSDRTWPARACCQAANGGRTMDGMSPDLRRKFVLLAIVAFAATATAQSCGSVTSAPDGGGAGAAGTSAGGTSAGGTSAGGTGAGGAAGRLDGGTDGPLACSLDQNNCPTGFT